MRGLPVPGFETGGGGTVKHVMQEWPPASSQQANENLAYMDTFKTVTKLWASKKTLSSRQSHNFPDTWLWPCKMRRHYLL